MSDGFDVRGRALRDGELAAWLAEHSLGNRFGLAVDGADAERGSEALHTSALAVVAADGDGRYIDIAAMAPDDEAALASWLADPGPPKAVHQAKSAMRALAGWGWSLRGVTSDTALAAHLLRPEQQTLALNELLIRHMRCALPSEALETQRFSSQPGGPDEQAVRSLILRACAVLDLADVLDEELARIDSSSVLSRLELPVQRVFSGMETAGIAADRALLTRIRSGATRLDDIIGILLNSIGSDGRIHTTFHQTGAVTGRLWSSDPNLHLDTGRRIREVFVPGDGYAELMTARYGQLETRVMTHLSGETGPIESSSSARLRGVVDDARKLGYAATLLGRRRYLPELDSADRQVRQAAERAALSMSVQGSAADIVKVAMIDVNHAIEDAGLKSRILLQVDDELVFEVAAAEREALAALACERMSGAYPLHVPLEVSVGCGPNWDAARVVS